MDSWYIFKMGALETARQEQALPFGGGVGEFCDIDHLVSINSHKRAKLVEFTVGKQLFSKYFCWDMSQKKTLLESSWSFLYSWCSQALMLMKLSTAVLVFFINIEIVFNLELES